MTTLETIKNIFPQSVDIPTEMNITTLLEQKTYLLDGELKQWNGATQDVLSPVFTNENGILTRKKLGSYPLLGEKEALEALASAQKAYNLGRGEWPTMPVKKRIEHMLRFTKMMKEQRTEVVKYLMWEIGKN